MAILSLASRQHKSAGRKPINRIAGKRLSKARKGITRIARRPSRIRIELPYGINHGWLEQLPLHAVITQLDNWQPEIDSLREPREAAATVCEIRSKDAGTGFDAWNVKVVGIIIEAPRDLARRLADNDGPIVTKPLSLPPR